MEQGFISMGMVTMYRSHEDTVQVFLVTYTSTSSLDLLVVFAGIPSVIQGYLLIG